MTTVRDVVTRALKRAAILNSRESASGSDASDTLAALNDMMHSWKARSVDVLHQGYSLSDTLAFFVPPKPNWIAHAEYAEGRLAKSLRNLSYQGTWDADANSPSLATSVGTQGHVYKVSTAGSTTLDSVTSWAVNDFALFDGSNWLKSQSVNPFVGGIVAMLAVRMCEEFGKDIKPVLARDSDDGWSLLLAQFMVPDQPTFDRGLSVMPSQRYFDIT